MVSLFPDESIVTESNDGLVILTTHRICYEAKEWGKAYSQNIMLEHITSCENHYENKFMFLLFGLLGIIGGSIAMANKNQAGFFAVICGIVLMFIYQRTKRNLIVISSPSTKMKINAAGMDRDKVLAFINRVEHTKHDRLLKLNK